MKKFLILFTGILILMLSGISAAAADSTDSTVSGKSEGTGYATPEEAAAAFIEGLKNQDVDQMTASFAIESYAENLNASEYIERYGSYNLYSGWVPNDTEFAVEINRAKRLENVLTQIRYLYMYLIKSEVSVGENAGLTITWHEDTEDISDFVGDLFYGIKDDLLVEFSGEFITPEEVCDVSDLENKLEKLKEMYAFLHADHTTSVIAKLKVDDENYLLCMDTISYNDQWYVLDLGGNVGNLMGLSSIEEGLISLGVE